MTVTNSDKNSVNVATKSPKEPSNKKCILLLHVFESWLKAAHFEIGSYTPSLGGMGNLSLPWGDDRDREESFALG